MYRLTYFDTNENVRISYLNNTGFPTKQEAIDEFDRIRNHYYKLESRGSFQYTNRIKFAVERLNAKKKWILEQRLKIRFNN